MYWFSTGTAAITVFSITVSRLPRGAQRATLTLRTQAIWGMSVQCIAERLERSSQRDALRHFMTKHGCDAVGVRSWMNANPVRQLTQEARQLPKGSHSALAKIKGGF
jgi:hypothetical protein